jgi:hypothetical protein
MFNKDVRVGLLLLLILVGLYGISYTFEGSALTTLQTGPEFFPRIVLLLAMGLSLLLVATNIGRKKKPIKEDPLSANAKKRVFGSMLIAILFGFSAVYIGTYVSIFLLTVGIMALWGVRNKLTIFLNAGLTTAGVYLVFTKVLLVQFPHGIFF